MGKTYKNFSLSQSFFSLLCNLLHQRKVVSTQLQTGYNGSQRVKTGPVTTGSNGFDRGRGGEERSMTRLLSPHNNIIYIIYPKKFYFSIHISSLSLSNNPRKYLYIKKNFILIHIYLFIYNINIHKTYFYPKNFATFNLFLIFILLLLLLLKFLVLL